MLFFCLIFKRLDLPVCSFHRARNMKFAKTLFASLNLTSVGAEMDSKETNAKLTKVILLYILKSGTDAPAF